MALLVTGRTLEEMRGEEFEIAQEQVLSYLAGAWARSLGRGCRARHRAQHGPHRAQSHRQRNRSERAPDGGPEDITDDLELVYSDQPHRQQRSDLGRWSTTSRGGSRRAASGRATTATGSICKHDVRIGGRPAPRRVPRQRPDGPCSVTVTGDGRLPETELRELLDRRRRRRFRLLRRRAIASRRSRRRLKKRDRLQSRVRLQRQDDAHRGDVDAACRGRPAGRSRLRGRHVPGQGARARSAPSGGAVSSTRQRIDDSVDVLRGWLMRDNYLQPKVEASVEDRRPGSANRALQDGPATTIRQGRRSRSRAPAASPPDELDKIIDEQKLEAAAVHRSRLQVTELLEALLPRAGVSWSRRVDAPRYEFHGTAGARRRQGREGPRFRRAMRSPPQAMP